MEVRKGPTGNVQSKDPTQMASFCFRRPQLALGPSLEVWDLHGVDGIALDAPKRSIDCFDNRKVHRLAAFGAYRARRTLAHGEAH